LFIAVLQFSPGVHTFALDIDYILDRGAHLLFE
jgi:hypothetical protein